MKILDTKSETQILAMIARGDAYEVIRQVLEDQGISITVSTISAVKSRNKEALAFMKNALVQHEIQASTKLLLKARELLERKLTRALNQEGELKRLRDKVINEEIDQKLFEYLYEKALKAELSVQELTMISKEMFHQSQLEQNKPTSIAENPAQAKENLKTLLEAINNKDERKIIEAIFPDVESKPI